VSSTALILVDDETLVREGIASLLTASGWIQVVAQLGDATRILEKAQQLQPDVILMKAHIAHCDALHILGTVSQSLPGTRFMVMTDLSSDHQGDIKAAIQAGARAVVSRAIEPQDLLACIRVVVNGGLVFATPTAGSMFEKLWASLDVGGESEESIWDYRAVPMALSDTSLSEREFDVLTLLAEGSSNKEIADLLFISENTAKTHVRNILEKLQLRSRTHAAAYAIRRGLVRGGRKAGEE
jgi:two-component system NarL family response regulator